MTLISLAGIERALSATRLAAYRQPEDKDDCDSLSRYLWNIALASALTPSLHTLEVAFRNEINRAAARLNAGRGFKTHRIDSWLDAYPTMLLEHEYKKVENAKEQLGTDPRSQTEGHLVAKLDFGFWVALCREPYDDTRGSGPRLWPRTLGVAFSQRPRNVKTRSEIFHMYNPIREFRNRVAHHEPIWDRQYLREHQRIIAGIRWLSEKLAATVEALAAAPEVFTKGPNQFRSSAERILGAPTASPTTQG